MPATLGLCRESDLPDLTRFLDAHWKAGHVFTTSRALLDWQHRDAGGSYTFVLARGAGGDLLGILGFIPTRRYDPALADANTIWLTTWKVRDDAGEAGLGLRMLRFVTAHEPHVAIGTITGNPATLPIYRSLGYATGELQHYVMRRDAVAPATGAVGVAAAEEPAVPRKTHTYISGRYASHPVYRYLIHAVDGASDPDARLVARVAAYPGGRALRVVDFVGPPADFAQSGGTLRRLIEENDADYADVYNAGFDPAVFERAGFTRVDPDGDVVVPDHFEPFDRRNVRLWFSMKAAVRPILFKGDADQDRPSQVPPS